MIEKIKEEIWRLLKDKEVSLVMIFDDGGHILWHRGRNIIETKKLARNCGYCTTPALQAIKERVTLRRNGCSISSADLGGSESARVLNIKTLVILPLVESYFLYVDSGVKEGFSAEDITVFETMGSLLGGVIQNLRSGATGSMRISGKSGMAAEIRESIAKYAIEEEPLLLLGETGVGKSMVAEMIHTYSGCKGPFMVVNTPGIPENLLESQLFGHRKGSFSGAVSDTKGFVEAAEGGTLFLDEIAELQPPLQAKLLRFLDTKLFHRLGETHERKANVRILAATNQDLQKAIRSRTFREDLFFRLNCLKIEIPPLRKRREDILPIIEDNLNLLRGKTLTAEALEVLRQYDWPGNVRELVHVLKLTGIHFSGAKIGKEIEKVLSFPKDAAGNADDPVERIWKEIASGQTFWEAVRKPFSNHELTRSQVKAILDRAMEQAGGRYRRLMKLFHLNENEYKNFMSFLYDNNLK